MTAPPWRLAIYLSLPVAYFATLLVLKWRSKRKCRRWFRENREMLKRVAKWN